MDLHKELIGRAVELKPVFAARAAATERNKAPLDVTIQELRNAGFFAILSPKKYGGHELNVGTMVGVTRVLAAACPSSAWVAAFYIGHNWLQAVFPEQGQREIFDGAPYRLSSGQLAPTAKVSKVKGGYVLSGRQAWSSGVVHAEWVFFTGLVMDDGQAPHPFMFAIPSSHVTRIDGTWDIAGMQGTGSYDVAIDEVFVPDRRAVSAVALNNGTHPGRDTHDNPLYHLPALAVLGYEAMPVLAGAARGAAESFLEMTKTRTASYTGASVAAKPAAQMRIGRAFANAAVIDAMVDDAVGSMVNRDMSRPVTTFDTLQLRVRAAMITKTACDAVNDIMVGAGTNSFRSECALQRFWRDVNVLRTHAILDLEPTSEVYGLAVLEAQAESGPPR